MLTVYHGATCVVERPLCNVGRRNLDFGQGFYVTDLQEQAISWATRIVNMGLPQVLNIYELDIERVHANYRCLRFEAYDEAWLNFIAHSRKGLESWREYDFIEGGIADDRVINTIEDYINGDIPVDFALKRLAQHLPNNQICLLNQTLVSECLHYVRTKPLNELAQNKGGELC